LLLNRKAFRSLGKFDGEAVFAMIHLNEDPGNKAGSTATETERVRHHPQVHLSLDLPVGHG
jgi:hypothetical protein